MIISRKQKYQQLKIDKQHEINELYSRIAVRVVLLAATVIMVQLCTELANSPVLKCYGYNIYDQVLHVNQVFIKDKISVYDRDETKPRQDDNLTAIPKNVKNEFEDQQKVKEDDRHNFYWNEKTRNHSYAHKIEPKIDAKQPDNFKANQIQDRNDQSAECVMQTSMGLCVRLKDVERALNRAKMILGSSSSEAEQDSDSNEPSEATLNYVGQIVEIATGKLARRFNFDWLDMSLGVAEIDMSQTSLWNICPKPMRGLECVGLSRFRSHTGICNNLLRPWWGSSLTNFVRFLPPDYADGVGSPRGQLTSGQTSSVLPNVRLVSRLLHPDVYNPDSVSSALFVSFGQLLNHDIALAAPPTVATGHGFSCCGGSRSAGGGGSAARRSCMQVQISAQDPVYGPTGVRCLDVKRALAGLRQGCSLGVREQVNAVSAYIDASFVYGPLESQTQALRDSDGDGPATRGQLRVWRYFAERGLPLKHLLPAQSEEPDNECVGRASTDNLFCFDSGDRRVNQQPPLAMLHTLFVRHHNRLARRLTDLNPRWPEARVYHEARHILIAQLQHIVYSEFLPQLLGKHLMARLKLIEASPGSHWSGYDPHVNPGVSADFAAAAFRVGHSMVPAQMLRVNARMRVTNTYSLRDVYRQPWMLFEPDAIDELLRGQLVSGAQLADPFVSVELAGQLLKLPDQPVGHDLVAINLQRGRDMGLPSYNAVRAWCGFNRVSVFSELSGVMTSRSAETLSSLYAHVDDIDLFAGGLSEFRMQGSRLGPTFACIIGRQFARLRFGDRFWFESSDGPNAFTTSQLDSIRDTTLASLLCSNSDSLNQIQINALKLPHPILNSQVSCSSLPEVDLSLWLDNQ